MSKELYRVSASDGKYTLVIDQYYEAKALRYGDAWPAYDGVKIQSIAKHMASGLNDARTTLLSSRDLLIQHFGENLSTYPEPVLKAVQLINAEIRSIGVEGS